MPEILSPGVYVQEFAIGATPIQGAGTSTAGFIGLAEKGPTVGLPIFISSMNDFIQQFGGYLPDSLGTYRYLAYAVNSFFTNGGSGCYVMRVAPSDATAASNSSIPTGITLALARDAAAGDSVLYLPSLFGIDSTSTLSITSYNTDGTVNKTESLSITSYDATQSTVTIGTALVNSYAANTTLVRVTKLPGTLVAAGTTLGLSAVNKGAWGNYITVQVIPASITHTGIKAAVGTAASTLQYEVINVNGLYVGAIVEVDDATSLTKQYTKITAILNNLVTFSDHLTFNLTDINKVTIRTCEFTLSVICNDQQETFANLSMNPAVPNYYIKKINGISSLITATPLYANAAAFTRNDPFDMPTNHELRFVALAGTDKLATIIGTWLSNGFDGTTTNISAALFQGTDGGPGNRTGIQAFVDIEDVSIMALPGVVDHDANLALIAHCENKKDRFAVIDIDSNISKVTDCQNERNVYSSSYAAIYHPWIQTIDPLSGNNFFMPPSGAVIGIYARTDNAIGVHKAPANEPILDASDLKFRFATAEQDKLNPVGVNLIRAFPGRGIRVWGARTLSGDPLWQYVNVRRLFIYLEKSIQNSTQWVVFEPNDIPLWARVKQTIVQFLTDQWRAGMLAGASIDEAFFVKCDRTTMSQGDIDNGRLICMIGVAPVKPAEFVIFRIAQWTLGAKS